MRLYTHTHTHTHTDNLVNKKGITLVALVVTIVVLLILAGVSINLVLGQNGLITNAKEAKISQEFSTYKEKMNFFIAEKKIESENFNPESITAYKEKLYYNTKKESDEDGIEEVLGKMSNKYLEKIQIIKGEIYINTEDNTEIKVAQNTGIKTISLDIVDGTLISSNKNLELKDEEGTIIIPPSVKKIGEGTFSGVKDLKKIIIPGTVEEIGKNAFSGNQTLEEVIIEDGVKNVREYAFSKCTNLKSISFPDSVTNIGKSCMWGCSNLISVRLSNGINIIKGNLFNACINLKEVKIPENVTEIEGYSFGGCKALESIEIPANVKTIGSGAFGSTTNLKNINIDTNNEYLKFDNGLLMSKDGKNVYFGLISLTSIVVPEGTEKIYADAFNSSKANTISIPNSVESLTGYEFAGMNQLKTIIVKEDNENYKVENDNLYSKNGKILVQYLNSDDSIVIPEGVVSLAAYAIRNKNVSSIKLPTTMKNFNWASFSGVTCTEVIDIPKNVKPFDGMAFTSGVKFKVSKDNQNIKSIDDTMILSKDGKILYATSKAVGEFNIPDTVEKIEYQSFYMNSKMTKIDIPSSVKEISYKAFGYTTLEQINISEGIEKIENNAFIGCSSLSKIKINKKKGSVLNSPWSCPMGEKVIQWQ